MKKAGLFLLFIVYSVIVSAQIDSVLSLKIENLQIVSNPSDKHYATKLVLDELLDKLKLGNLPVLASNSSLQQIAPPDSSFTVYYLTSIFESGDYQLDWLVVYKRLGKPQAYRFTEKITNSIYKSNLQPQLVASLQKYDLNNSLHRYYKLAFIDKVANKEIFVYDDVLIKAYFIELANMQFDSDKFALNSHIDSLLTPLLLSNDLFSNNFLGFDKMGTILSGDNEVKVVTWNISLEDGSYRYFGDVILNRNGKLKLFQLKEFQFNSDKTDNQSLNANRWYGNDYYQIVDGKDVKNNKFYMLIGGRTNSELTKCKVIDVLWFTSGGELRFGSQLFDLGKGSPRRLVYEYSAYSSMMVRYDDGQKMIVMDHLSPKDPEFQGNARFYVPDFSYDALRFEKGKWVLIPDIDLRNPNRAIIGRKPKSNKL